MKFNTLAVSIIVNGEYLQQRVNGKVRQQCVAKVYVDDSEVNEFEMCINRIRDHDKRWSVKIYRHDDGPDFLPFIERVHKFRKLVASYRASCIRDPDNMKTRTELKKMIEMKVSHNILFKIVLLIQSLTQSSFQVEIKFPWKYFSF